MKVGSQRKSMERKKRFATSAQYASSLELIREASRARLREKICIVAKMAISNLPVKLYIEAL